MLAIKIIKLEWWTYYSKNSVVKFIENSNIDLAALWGKSDTSVHSPKHSPKFLSPRLKTEMEYVDSCPSTPSPRSLRRNSLIMIASFP